jgi:arsenate reductase
MTPGKPLDVLFLCTGNSARSILGEVLLRDCGRGRFRTWSAGSHPKGEVHPLAVETLQKHGHRTDGLRSKSWDELARPGAPARDIVLTVCASAAGESCPVWPGAPVRARWPIDDPASVGSYDSRRLAFELAYERMRRRVEALVAIPVETLEPAALAAHLARIGETADH